MFLICYKKGLTCPVLAMTFILIWAAYVADVIKEQTRQRKTGIPTSTKAVSTKKLVCATFICIQKTKDVS